MGIAEEASAVGGEITLTTVRRMKATITRTAPASTRDKPHLIILLKIPFRPMETRGCGSTSPRLWLGDSTTRRDSEGSFARGKSTIQGTGLPVMPAAASSPDLNPS